MERQYELVALFPVKMNDIMAEKTLVDLVKANQFKVVEVDKWGAKPLAYAIKKENKAYYLRLVIEGGNAKTLASALKIEESLLRHLLVRLSTDAKASVDLRPVKVVVGKENK